MTLSTQFKKNLPKYLAYATIALLFINSVLMFFPFVEVYQPSYRETALISGDVRYRGWYTQSASMVKLIVPVFLTGLPYFYSILSLSAAFREKNNKNGVFKVISNSDGFFKIINNSVNKPLKFWGLKFGAIAYLITARWSFSELKKKVSYYEKYGAYCHITFWGVLNIICTIAFIVLLFALSHKSKSMVASVNKAQIEATDSQITDEMETTEEIKTGEDEQ